MADLRLVVLGLSLSSSWGNGHATTYRALLRALADRGARISFLERDMPWYRQNRDMPEPDFARLQLYDDLAGLRRRFRREVREADAVLVGSYVPEGVAVIDWVLEEARGPVAFYDIDTPVTLAALERGEEAYLAARQIPEFDVFLSFAGGPVIRRLRDSFGARRARPLYSSVDASRYAPDPDVRRDWELGYLGTYSSDRQPTLERLLIASARRRARARFAVAGPQYPPGISWPANVERIEHLPPVRHAAFYNGQMFTLNITRKDMIAAGWSPSVRLFEAAACATPVISDWWEGLDDFFPVDKAVLVARSTEDVLAHLDRSDASRRAIGEAAREIVLARHSASVRAAELEACLEEAAYVREAVT